jgi:hypothetical protein
VYLEHILESSPVQKARSAGQYDTKLHTGLGPREEWVRCRQSSTERVKRHILWSQLAWHSSRVAVIWPPMGGMLHAPTRGKLLEFHGCGGAGEASRPPGCRGLWPYALVSTNGPRPRIPKVIRVTGHTQNGQPKNQPQLTVSLPTNSSTHPSPPRSLRGGCCAASRAFSGTALSARGSTTGTGASITPHEVGANVQLAGFHRRISLRPLEREAKFRVLVGRSRSAWSISAAGAGGCACAAGSSAARSCSTGSSSNVGARRSHDIFRGSSRVLGIYELPPYSS